MSSKRKCRLCGESMGWALPDRVTSKNYEYAKRCLYMAKNTLVCGYTMKTKRIEHEQYCKHFVPKDEIELDYEENTLVDELNNLENMIKEYEKQNEVIPKWAEQISINSSTAGRKGSSPGARKRNGGLSVVNRKARVYISGKITGTTDFMDRFAKAEEKLKAEGYAVLNPAHANSYMPEDTTWDEYMKVSLTLLQMADAIYMLDGWEDSKGARQEYDMAVNPLHLKIMYENA